jgi:hypothetical protein
MAVLSLFAVLSLIAGCASDEAAHGRDDAQDNAIASRSEALERSAAPYFVGRQDMRRCRWPLCGGYWVRRVNRASQRCPDGSVAAECYVALLDTEALAGTTLPNFGDGKTVVRAVFGSGDAGEFGTYALLRVSAAWRAATDTPAQGAFYLLQDSGIRCVRAPCFSWTAYILNTARSRAYSDNDLTAVGASEKQLELAQLALAEQGLVATGRFTSPGTGGVSFQATQFYLPVVTAEPAGECTTDADCTLSLYSAPVSSAADCYCPTCPLPMTAAAASIYSAGWQSYCAETHGFDVCPPPPCAAPPPVACVAGTCGYSFESPAP